MCLLVATFLFDFFNCLVGHRTEHELIGGRHFMVWSHESAESGTAAVAGQDSPLLLTQFQLVRHQVFQQDCCYAHF